jgi:prolyl-tRNA synthetase
LTGGRVSSMIGFMLQSHLFTKTRKEAPADEVSKNASLLIRAGYIHKEMAGVYALLPLGVRVIEKIKQVVREEMNAIGGQEVVLTALQDKNLWEKTNRWSDMVVDNWFKTKLKNDTEVGLGFSHEEPLTQIIAEYASSYRDLPISAYQFQTKFRNELRAKSGIMRGREFTMKDLYTFARTEEEHTKMYRGVRDAYVKIFDRLGLGAFTYITFASGGVFSKFSEEFQTVSDAGEDIIYIDEKKKLAVNKEVHTDELLKDVGLSKSDLEEKKAIEVGNIFNLGTRYSEPLGLFYTDENGEKKPVIMGCYGIGITRLMGTIVEVLSDPRGIVWPAAVAPFDIHLIPVGQSEVVGAETAKLYAALEEEGFDVLLDDRDLRPGEKFADSDLIGIPKRIVISEKTLAEKKYELKDRKTGEIEMISIGSNVLRKK